MKIRLASLAALLLALSACADSNMVDGKATVDVPNPSGSPAVVTCYLLEVERIDGSSGREQGADSYICVTKEQWNLNHEGEELVDADGRVIK